MMKVPTAEVFEPLLHPSRYKGAYGGRGSGKSHFFAELLVDDHYRKPGFRSVCIREVQKSLKDSAKRLIEDKIQKMGLGPHFDIREDRIISRGDGVILFQGMQDHTAETIKSLESFNRAWIEEAQTLSEVSFEMLRPTFFRVDDSEIWASWNPRKRTDAIDVYLRGKKPASAIVVQANWKDNPWFPPGLEEERQDDLKNYPERYGHVWDGDYASAFKGAYFAAGLLKAKQDNRISHVAADPLLPIRSFHDIGGTSAQSDAYTIWIVQWVGERILILDYYESVGQPLEHHVNWMRKHGWEDAKVILPHDGTKPDHVVGGKKYRDHWEDAGFDAEVIPNQGAGAASMRVEAVRRIFNKCWFNEQTTEPGRLALGFYHERKDPKRDIGLGPEHDWSSHCADAFGLMAVAYEIPTERGDMMPKFTRYRSGGWQGA